MSLKKGLICVSIVTIVVLCTLNVVTASTGSYSTTFYNIARHIGNHISMMRGSTSNGVLNRSYVTNGILTSSATINEVVYIGSGDNVYAFNANTGTKIWNYTAGNFVWSSPAIANGIVYVGSADCNVYALDAKTGTKVWNYKTRGFVNSSPSVTNGVVYDGSFVDGSIYATGMPLDTNAIQFIQDLFQQLIGAVQDGSINQLGIWGIHHQKLVILGTPRVLLPSLCD